MKGNITFSNIVIEVDVDGEAYPLSLEGKTVTYKNQEWESPEEFESLIEDLMDDLSDDLGWCILSVDYDHSEVE